MCSGFRGVRLSGRNDNNGMKYRKLKQTRMRTAIINNSIPNMSCVHGFQRGDIIIMNMLYTVLY